ncbi:MAG: FHA domain-containing protein [Gammaproteobacteria bacterium]|nr:FHA domain-containing protein [Gammaproteobacteria bacterium]
MALVALEVNGAALVGATSAGVLFNEPGVALVQKRRVAFGREVVEEARRDPANSYRNYWELLSDESLPRPARGFRSYADLAHGQMQGLWKRFRESVGDISGVVLVIPAGVAEDRLALLLGIAEEAGLPVSGLVESGVAAVRGAASGRACLHVEATAERLAVSRLAAGDGRIRREEILFDGRPGLRHLRAAMISYVAGRFVAGSRFDPLDLPVTEQELAGRLDAWLQAVLSGGELGIELDAAPVTATAVLTRDDCLASIERLLGAAGNRLRSWCTGPGAADVYLSGTLAEAPGCAEVFARLLAMEVQVLPAGAAALGALERFTPMAGAKDRYVLLKSLPAADLADGPGTARNARPDPAAAPVAGNRETGERTPTHVVFGGRAWRIGAEGLHLGSSPQPGGLSIVLSPEGGISRNHCTVVLENGQAVLHDHSRYGTNLNGAPVADSAPLRGGDVVGVGPLEFLIAREVGGDGS